MTRTTLIWRLVFTVVLVAVLTLGVVAVVSASEPDVPATDVELIGETGNGRWRRYLVDGRECIALHNLHGGSVAVSCDWGDR